MYSIQAKAQAIYDELCQKNVSPARVKQLQAEMDKLDRDFRNREAAKRYGGTMMMSPAEFGLEGANPGDYDNGFSFKGFGPGMENRIRPTSEQESLWGVPVVQTTQQAAGTAAVLSVASGAAVVYVREPLSTFFDQYSQASSNIYQYIAETRLALATPRPQAINLVTGLPTS